MRLGHNLCLAVASFVRFDVAGQSVPPLKMEPLRCPETSVTNYQATARNIPEDFFFLPWISLCVVYIAGYLLIAINTTIYYVLSGELHCYIFRPLSFLFQAIKVHETEIIVESSLLFGEMAISVFGCHNIHVSKMLKPVKYMISNYMAR